MKDDRQKCLEAGASDYLAKPVSSEQLLSMLRVWLHRRADPSHADGDQGPLSRLNRPPHGSRD